MLILLLCFGSCDTDCTDDCPTDQISLEFEVIDSLGSNCSDLNSDLEAILLSSNDLNQDDVVLVVNGKLRLNIQPNITEYLLKYNQSDSLFLDLDSEQMIVTCCDSSFEVFVEYELTNRNTSNVICTNCVMLQVFIPSCD